MKVDQRLFDRAAHRMGDESAGRVRNVAEEITRPGSPCGQRPFATVAPSRHEQLFPAVERALTPSVAPSSSVTSRKVQFVFGETLTTIASIAAIVAIGGRAKSVSLS
jgi:hypothetical protein